VRARPGEGAHSQDTPCGWRSGLWQERAAAEALASGGKIVGWVKRSATHRRCLVGFAAAQPTLRRVVCPRRHGFAYIRRALSAGDQAMGDWIAFWDSEHPLYVNARHRDVHYRRIAEDIAAYVSSSAVVLDYGCGEALHADRIAARARKLILVEAAP